MTPTVGVVLVNYNGLADTRECLRSLAAVSYPRWFPVVVDNASTEDPTPILVSEFPGCPVLRQPVNAGWAGGNNAGIRFSLNHGADYVVLLNNDTVLAPELLGRLVSAAEAHRGYGVLGPVIRQFDPPHDVQTDGCVFNAPGRPEFFQRLEVPLAASDPPTVTDVDIVNGCCLMAPGAVFRRVGLIDERFFLIHEESDFCLRVRRAGLRCGVLGEALVRHKGSRSFRRSGLRGQRYYDARNLLLLLTKHGYLPGLRRGRLRSLLAYAKYAYARYEAERDAGCPNAADAVLEGVCDALTRNLGPHQPGDRLLLPLLRRLFELRRGRACRLDSAAKLPFPRFELPEGRTA
ncbi:MAG: glycosyltransferase family 2 protein [Gemmataceae bacterium]